MSFANASENVISKPNKINWDAKIKYRYINFINSDECKYIWSSFLSTGIQPEQNCIDASVKLLSDIMIETAERADLSIKTVRSIGPPVPRRGGCRVSKKKRPKQPEWYNADCSTAYRNLKETAKFLQRDPNNPWLRGKLFKEEKIV